MEIIEVKEDSVPDLLRKEPIGNSWYVFRAPPFFKISNPSAFAPCLVSLGPYHHNNPNLQVIENQKPSYLELYLTRVDRSVTLESLKNDVTDMEEAIRDVYCELPQLSSDELATMMVMDGCFVLMLVMVVTKQVTLPTDPTFISILPSLKRDILLLENQLPFPVLEALFAKLGLDTDVSLKRLVCDFFGDSLDLLSEWAVNRVENAEPMHILHLIQESLIPPSSCKGVVLKREIVFSAKDLYLRGIQVKPKRNPKTILDIELDNHTLCIPQLILDEFRETLYLNIMAYEQNFDLCGGYITSYVIFMRFLMTEVEDVSLLCNEDIIGNCHRSHKEISSFFTSISKGVIHGFSYRYFSGGYLGDVYDRLNAHTRRRRNRLWEGLKRMYRDKPIIVSLVFVVVFCAILQLIVNILKYLSSS